MPPKFFFQMCLGLLSKKCGLFMSATQLYSIQNKPAAARRKFNSRAEYLHSRQKSVSPTSRCEIVCSVLIKSDVTTEDEVNTYQNIIRMEPP